MSEMVALRQFEHIDQEERGRQLRCDLETQFAELVNGNMRTNFPLYFNGHDLISEDGRSLDKTTQDAYDDALRIAPADPSLYFGIRRTGLERQEFYDLIAMARGEGPNTKIVVSDFPKELWDSPKDVGGYNVQRKQTMVRVLTREQNGTIHMYSQSLDGSNRQALEAIYARFGCIPSEGELLGQHIDVEIPLSEQTTLVDELIGIHDRSLSAQFGGVWHAGRRPVDYRNTYDFVRQQQDLVDECIRLDKRGWLNEAFMYKIAATMNKRFEGESQTEYDRRTIPLIANLEVLHREVELAGAQARESGVSFSACGVTLEADGMHEKQFEQAGYGKKSSDDCEFISKKCPLCHAKNVKTKVTRTHISGSCGCSTKR